METGYLVKIVFYIYITNYYLPREEKQKQEEKTLEPTLVSSNTENNLFSVKLESWFMG